MEGASGPLAHGFVLFVSGVAPGFEEPDVAGRSADVLGRAMAGAVDAGRVFEASVFGDPLFEGDEVQPAVAEVVVVEQLRLRHVVEVEVTEMDVGGLEGPRIVFGGGLVRQFRRAVDEPADDEFVEMLVAPAEGGLQHVVQFRQVQRRRQQQASPDRRLDVLQRDLGLDDRLVDRSHIAIMAATRLCDNCARPATITRSSAPLPQGRFAFGSFRR